LYEKWDHGVTTINELGRKVYKKFYSKEKALEFMNKNLSDGRWAVYWDRKQSPNFYYAGVETI
jgi:viroplasmin and RNaseH domain-containing protein